MIGCKVTVRDRGYVVQERTITGMWFAFLYQIAEAAAPGNVLNELEETYGYRQSDLVGKTPAELRAMIWTTGPPVDPPETLPDGTVVDYSPYVVPIRDRAHDFLTEYILGRAAFDNDLTGTAI